ncbi:MAG: DUF3576 domain-containing protein [Rickettsiaceae bacterium]|nr:DUF3576 domain-containing protein [Rickettsiaceae bacterium]
MQSAKISFWKIIVLLNSAFTSSVVNCYAQSSNYTSNSESTNSQDDNIQSKLFSIQDIATTSLNLKLKNIKSITCNKQSEYLWRASKDKFSSTPIIYIDDKNKTIITEWHHGKLEETTHLYKIILTLPSESEVNSPEINVSVFLKYKDSEEIILQRDISAQLEEEILLKALQISAQDN